jgi:hypothetical protein
MKRNTVVDLAGRTTMPDRLTELPRTGAEHFIYQAVEAELREVLTGHSRRRTENARRGVVCNVYPPERALQTWDSDR